MENSMPITKEFVLAGNATLTIDTPDRGHRTYRVRYKAAGGGYPEAWFVSLLTGPDNENSYTYMGKLDKETGQCVMTAKSRYSYDSYPVQLLSRTLAHVWVGDHEAYEKHGYSTHHEGRCGRCGRKLTVPESIAMGIGPECAGIVYGANAKLLIAAAGSLELEDLGDA
jgi:hypothetical protein